MQICCFTGWPPHKSRSLFRFCPSLLKVHGVVSNPSASAVLNVLEQVPPVLRLLLSPSAPAKYAKQKSKMWKHDLKMATAVCDIALRSRLLKLAATPTEPDADAEERLTEAARTWRSRRKWTRKPCRLWRRTPEVSAAFEETLLQPPAWLQQRSPGLPGAGAVTGAWWRSRKSRSWNFQNR